MVSETHCACYMQAELVGIAEAPLNAYLAAVLGSPNAGVARADLAADVASVSLRAGQAEPIFIGGGQGMMEALPGPPGMMMGDPMQGLPGAPFPGSLFPKHNFNVVMNCFPAPALLASYST